MSSPGQIRIAGWATHLRLSVGAVSLGTVKTPGGMVDSTVELSGQEPEVFHTQWLGIKHAERACKLPYEGELRVSLHRTLVDVFNEQRPSMGLFCRIGSYVPCLATGAMSDVHVTKYEIRFEGAFLRLEATHSPGATPHHIQIADAVRKGLHNLLKREAMEWAAKFYEGKAVRDFMEALKEYNLSAGTDMGRITSDHAIVFEDTVVGLDGPDHIYTDTEGEPQLLGKEDSDEV